MTSLDRACHQCGGSTWREMTFAMEVQMHNQTITVDGLVGLTCDACGEELLLPEHIRRNDELVAKARRDALSKKLLPPGRVRTIRENLKLTQQEAASYFGGGVNAFSKYERGVVTQSEAMDRLIRLVGMYPSLLDHLKEWSGVKTESVHTSTERSAYQFSPSQPTVPSSRKTAAPPVLAEGHDVEGQQQWRRQA